MTTILEKIDTWLKEEHAQRFSSKLTSVNVLPKLFKHSSIIWKKGTTNLDLGGGRFDTTTNYLNKKGVTNFVYDPYWKSKEHNTKVLSNKNYNTATISNVLNVIAEPEEQEALIKKAYDRAPILYITAWKNPKQKEAKSDEKRNSFQHHKKIDEYVPIVKKYYPNVVIKSGVIHAWK